MDFNRWKSMINALLFVYIRKACFYGECVCVCVFVTCVYTCIYTRYRIGQGRDECRRRVQDMATEASGPDRGDIISLTREPQKRHSSSDYFDSTGAENWFSLCASRNRLKRGKLNFKKNLNLVSSILLDFQVRTVGSTRLFYKRKRSSSQEPWRAWIVVLYE